MEKDLRNEESDKNSVYRACEEVRTVEIFGENRFPEYTKMREACRGILLRDGMLLTSYEVNTDQYFIPGGGVEEGESLTECCIRELIEETGCKALPKRHFLTVREFYEEYMYVSHYFLCEYVENTERQLTQRELEAGLEPRWIPYGEALYIFSRHAEYSEMKYGAYLREYTALSELMLLK